MIEGLAVWIGPEAVLLTSACPLTTLSSAVCGGGLVSARAIVNLHVALDDPCTDPPSMFGAYVRAQDAPEPYVGLLTGAWARHGGRGARRGHPYHRGGHGGIEQSRGRGARAGH